LTLSIFADGVENPANLARLDDVARALGASCSNGIDGSLIALENTPTASSIYGRRPLSTRATLAVGNERRGLSARTLDRADETLAIPTLSRTVKTLNVAAAAAVAGWYVLRGSAAQALTSRAEVRRPTVLIVGTDHVEVGSTLRSAAAFGFRGVLLEDRDAGWFGGSAGVRREARAAARRHKNPLRIHRATLADADRFDDIVAIVESGQAPSIQREHLARGRRQVVIIGAARDEIESLAAHRIRVASLHLADDVASLRLLASIALAEIARQVGRRRRGPPAPTPVRYAAAVKLRMPEDIVWVDPATLLVY
jgi:tRNA G18 (ribose-2'-O)-methylase SpoU